MADPLFPTSPQMTRIVVMITESLATVKARLSAFVEDVFRTHERVVITRNGEPVAVLIAPDDLESMEETIEILSDVELMKSLRRARRDVAAGRTYGLDEVRRRSGA